MAKSVKYKTKLDRFSMESGWHFIPVSKEVVDRFKFEGKSKRAVCTLNDTETIQCGLMPHDGNFFILVNKAIRTRLQIEAGDQVTVELVKDESKYGLPMPAEFREVLDQDPFGDKLFHALTPGKQRSMLYYIGKIKDIDKCIHASLIFIDHLKENDGNIDNKKLLKELKRPMF